MKPQYIVIIGGTPKTIALDTNVVNFDVSITTDATTTEVALANPNDSVKPNSWTPPVNPNPPVWIAAPAPDALGVIHLVDPVSAVRFTKATNGVATILQQGLR